MTSLLSVNNLGVKFQSDGSEVIAVDGIDFKINKGEVLALVGESGSGKSVSALSILSLLPNNADVSGSIKLQGIELLGISHKELKSVRGSEVSFIFQEPMTSLNPFHRVGDQIIDLSKNDGRADAFVSPNKFGLFSEYQFSVDNLEQFSGFKIKIVMTSTNESYPVRIKDFRAIALA